MSPRGSSPSLSLAFAFASLCAVALGLTAAVLPGCGGPLTTTADAGADNKDAAAPADAGTLDGASGDDATDEASAPPRADVPAVPCTDALDDVYVTPPNLPPMTPAARGDIVRCAVDFSLDLPTTQAQVASKGLTTTMTTGVATYRIAFRTTRGDGSPGVSTARVYLPKAPGALPLPVLVAAHPTDGLADSVAPSKTPTSNEDLALPWAGLGEAIIVPDYAGLGNEGVQGYLDNHDQAHSVLDGARALRKLLSPGALSSHVLLIGYSQGGGAVLSAQALASGYGADGTVDGVIAFAPEWPTRLNSFGFVDMLRNPGELTIQTGISAVVVEVMRAYAYFANHVGLAHADDGFPLGQRSGFEGAINGLSEALLGAYLQGNALHVSDFIDEGLRTSLLACIDDGANDPACVDPGKGFFAFMQGGFVTSPPGAKVLYLQGLADYIMPAPSEAACNVAKLELDGVTPQVCVDAPAQHTNVVGRNMDFALQWGAALGSGGALPACTTTGILPPCLP